MSKGAQTIAPVDNTKDDLYAILRKRLFQKIEASENDIKAVADAYRAEMKTASAVIESTAASVREEILVSYPFHFSTKHLIGMFNDNPGFQKTRDVIRLMATIVCSLWKKGESVVSQHQLISFEMADLNDTVVASRFIEIKKSLRDALQTDIANAGTSHCESLDAETEGLASRCARWIYTASLSEIRPRGLTDRELAEYLIAPRQPITGLQNALKQIYDACWYIEQTQSSRYLFHRQKNLNAQINDYAKRCTPKDRDEQIAIKLTEMFEPKDKRCYQKVAVLPALNEVHLERDRTTLVVCKPDTDFKNYFSKEKYQNRVAFLTAIDQTGLFNVNKNAERLWAIGEVVKDLTPEDTQYRKAKETLTACQTDLFIALKGVFNKFYYPVIDPNNQETALVSTTLFDGYKDEKTGNIIKYRNEDATKGEFVVEATLRDTSKFQEFVTSSDRDKIKIYQPLRIRLETFLFPSTGRTTWEQIKDGAASRGHIIWTEPNTLEQMRDALITAGEWREDAGQIQKPPFEEVTGVAIEHSRDRETGEITTTDIKLINADRLFLRKDAGEWEAISAEEPVVTDAMHLEFKAVDSKGENKEGEVYRIKNWIDLTHDFFPSENSNHQFLKVGVVPPRSNLLYTIDGSDPANNGQHYQAPGGIEVREGGKVRLYAEKGGVNEEIEIPVPKGSGTNGGGIDPTKPVRVRGKAFKHLVSRSNCYQFLNDLPEDVRLQFAEAKVTSPSSGEMVTLTWDRKILLSPARIRAAFEYLDTEVPKGDWFLQFDQLHFAAGRDLLRWQAETNIKIKLELITQ